MKNFFAYLISILAIVICVALVWWNINKKSVLKNTLQNSISNATNGAYILKYDSSFVDEVGGNASFYNITLLPDSLVKQNDTKLSIALKVKQIDIIGVNIKEFLNQNVINANTLNIINASVSIAITDTTNTINLTKDDTLALYKKIIGNFKSIKANKINLLEANINVKQLNKKVNIAGINIALNSLVIDSSKNYSNLISYFINDVIVKIKKVENTNLDTHTKLLFTNVAYDAFKKTVSIDTITQTNTLLNFINFVFYDNQILNLSTNAFITKQAIQAGELKSKGGYVGIKKSRNKTLDNKKITLQNNILDNAIINKIAIGSTDIAFFENVEDGTPSILFKNVKLDANKVFIKTFETEILKIIDNTNWKLTCAGTQLYTKKKDYKINVGNVTINNFTKTIEVASFTFKSIFSENEFAKKLSFQKDRYDLKFTNIVLKNVNYFSLIKNKTLLVDELLLSPTILIYNDKTVPEQLAAKIGYYPHQMLKKIETKFAIKNIKLVDGYISYKEKAAESKKVGNVFFTKINGTMQHVSNISDANTIEPYLKLNVNCLFLNMAKVNTTWQLPLLNSTANFNIQGTIQSFDATKLNPITIPLGLAKIQSGTINNYSFDIAGNDYQAKGKAVLLYNNLKLNLLKQVDGDSTLKSKKGLNFIANSFIKNNNPTNGKLREGNCKFERVMHKSFFNLVWKSVYAGAKTSTF